MIKRKHHRHFFHQYINYRTDLEHSSCDDACFKGVTINMSNGGLCLFVDKPLCEGDKIRILKNNATGPDKTAIVRWVKLVNNEIYKIGLMFEC